MGVEGGAEGTEAGGKPPFLRCLLIIGSPEPAWDTRASGVRKWHNAALSGGPCLVLGPV